MSLRPSYRRAPLVSRALRGPRTTTGGVREASRPAHIVLLAALWAAGCLTGGSRPPCDDEGPIETVCGFRNPEDLEHVPAAGIILATNMRFDGPVEDGGFIAALAPENREARLVWPAQSDPGGQPQPSLGDPACTEPPDREAFYPHGLTSASRDGRVLVHVAAHAGDLGGREAVEVFELDGTGEAATLHWRACIPTPGGIQANDVAVTADGEVVVSNYQPDGSLRNSVKAALLGTKTGNVMAWRPGQGWRVVERTDALMANGVAVTRDGDMLFYTESVTGKVYRTPMDGRGGTIAVEIGGTPDNLTWTGDGKLLVATHTSATALFLCMLGKAPCTSGWSVYEIDPGTMATSLVLTHQGDTIGAVSTAVEVGKALYLGSVYDDRIGVVALN